MLESSCVVLVFASKIIIQFVPEGLSYGMLW